MRRFSGLWSLSLLLGACDVSELVPEAEEAPGAEASRPPSEHDLRAAPEDPARLQLLCLLCGLGGSQEVCGANNQTYANECYATCKHVAVIHTGECRCGDGYAGPGEACDDGNAANTDACLATCVPASCGDGFVWANHEVCDDGDAANDDACLATCVPASCGDGFVRAGVEACDDGNSSDSDACPSTCAPASCGDGFVRAGVEACDDGNTSDGDACLSSCEPASCGDGFVRAGVEACDDGDADDGDACLSSCEAAACGDGHLQVGVEACDDGDLASDDACLASCAPASCGDGFLHVGVEGCDDNNLFDNDACLASCEPASCGDGVRWFGVEGCDDGNAVDTDACLSDCVEAVCGDGVVWAGVEGCDDGDGDDGDECLSTCAPASCGDGHVRAGVETCDDGDEDDGDACPGTCQTAHCGDGFVRAGVEQCDDGDADATDGCTNACKTATCGDGFVHAGVEACDDGNTSDGDACLASCVPATCGDGHVRVGVETCDDGNAVATDGCTNACKPAVCGDGVIHAGVEQCDDGNAVATDGCTNACAPAACGDGVVRAGVEQCDDGDQVGGDGCSSACKLEVCGDGVVAVGEQCDDGNASDDDECRTDCTRQRVVRMFGGSCAQFTDGRVKCWGANLHGRLGLGDTAHRGDDPGEMGAALPFLDLGEGAVVDHIALGGHACALLTNGRVKCWGDNSVGQLGLGVVGGARGDEPGEMGDALPYVDFGQGRTATAVTVANQSTCALLDGGDVKCFGTNNQGQLGRGDRQTIGDEPGEMGDALAVVDLGTNAQVVALAAGTWYHCALLSGGAVKCWGYNPDGQLGQGDGNFRGDAPGEMGDALLPIALAGPATALAVGANFTCALLTDGRVQCWGINVVGQLGLGDTQDRGDEPNEMGVHLPTVDLGAGKRADQIVAGTHGACVRLIGGGVKCWGYNPQGQLGLGDNDNRGDEPGEMGDALPTVDLGGGQTPASLSLAYLSATCAVLGDGSVKCFGANLLGQLGQGDKLSRGDEPGEMGDALPRVRLFSDTW